jgi:gliding motility-associated-like protein
MKRTFLLFFLIIQLAMNQQLLSQVSTVGLVAYYPFNGNSKDESGHGNDGFNNNAVLTYDRFGKADCAYTFNGIDQYIMVPSADILEISGPISMCAWFKTREVKSYAGIVCKAPSEEPRSGYILCVDNNDKARVFFVNDHRVNEKFGTIASDMSLNDDIWHFVVSVYDGSQALLYIDGKLNAKVNYTWGMQKTKDPLLIGWDRNTYLSDRFFEGEIDEVMIYNRALNAKEILDLFESDKTISGSKMVCQGQKGVSYSVSNLNGNGGFFWSYNGMGATIHANSDKAVIDFAENATSGILKVLGNNGTESVSLSITVNHLPNNPGIISGNDQVCQNQNGIVYNTPKIQNAENYIWDYSGIGVNIIGNSNNVTIDFSSNATDGYLSVKGVNTCGSSIFSAPFFVSVNTLPVSPKEISGESIVCQNQKEVHYFTPPLDNASNYSWQFSGKGANFRGSSNNVIIDFSADATDGYLTVNGINTCGAGTSSAPFFITVSRLPDFPGDIVGEKYVCKNENGLRYSIPAIIDASSFLWDFSGSGATLLGNTENIEINFDQNATSGYLTVTGTNDCGIGPLSTPYFIHVSSCVQVEPDENINIPNSFTPNSDNINDQFVIRGLSAKSKLKVFNRLGNLVYKSDDYNNDWTGKDFNGNVLESDTYWYVLVIPHIPTEFKGFVYLKK